MIAAEILDLKRQLDVLNSATRHTNLKIVSGMYYDHLQPPTTFCSQPSSEPFNSDEWDYVRFRTLELVSDFIHERKITGALAEAGVFRAKFSRRMSALLPERTIYLFDTFEGFSLEEIGAEYEIGRIGSGFVELSKQYCQTSIQHVLSSMPNQDKCIICKGDFAETSSYVEDNFALVSIDMDLFNPTFQALEFFWPRLVRGGYIFIHDYHHDEIYGVKDAVKRYMELNPSVCIVPIADQCGSVVITK